jgi:hypothetical protein
MAYCPWVSTAFTVALVTTQGLLSQDYRTSCLTAQGCIAACGITYTPWPEWRQSCVIPSAPLHYNTAQ